jgi:transcriptional regulator with XRE-family HTH domain
LADGSCRGDHDVLTEVASRRRTLRTERGMTLVELSEATGISNSTLSRLETGQRKLSRELMLLIAEAYRVALDDLLGAPEVGDPRIRPQARKPDARVVVPLTGHPNGTHAWTVVIPPARERPQLESHDGYEWLYVSRRKNAR